MKKSYFLFTIIGLLLLSPLWVISQDITLKTTDSTAAAVNDKYIKKYHDQLNINFEISNERTNYNVSYANEIAKITPNLNNRYAFVFGYRFLSVRLGIRPPISNEEKKNKGDSKTFRLRVKLLFDNWSHHLLYNRHKGYYIKNTDDFNVAPLTNTDFHIQFPELTTNVFQGSSVYKFNKNYSLRAIENQTEIQLKSVGTFMPGLDYKYYILEGAEKVKVANDKTIYRETYSDVSGFSFIANAAYHYTYVFHKYWFANTYASPGIGLDIFKIKTHTLENTQEFNDNDFFFAFKTGISGGYNGEKIYAGAGYNYYYQSEKFAGDELHVQPSRDKFHVYVGYRFRAPKQLRKPMDYIEKKVPLLKEDNDKN